MQKRRQYRELPDIELGPALDRKIRAMTLAADRDIAELQAKARIHSVVLSFLRSRPGLHEYVARFGQRWDRLKDLAIENLAADPARRTASESRVSLMAARFADEADEDISATAAFLRSPRGLGTPRRAYNGVTPIYDRDDPIGMVVSVTSWAVLTSTTKEEAVAKEASSRGMPDPVVKALSTHLAAELSSGNQDALDQRRRRQGR